MEQEENYWTIFLKVNVNNFRGRKWIHFFSREATLFNVSSFLNEGQLLKINLKKISLGHF